MSSFPSLSMENHAYETDFRYEGKTCSSVISMETRLNRNLSVEGGVLLTSEGQKGRRKSFGSYFEVLLLA